MKIFDEIKIQRLFILVDKENIIRCIVSERENLHQDKIDQGMEMFELAGEDYGERIIDIFPGDWFDPETGNITSNPENHAPLPEKIDNVAELESRVSSLEALVSTLLNKK